MDLLSDNKTRLQPVFVFLTAEIPLVLRAKKGGKVVVTRPEHLPVPRPIHWSAPNCRPWRKKKSKWTQTTQLHPALIDHWETTSLKRPHISGEMRMFQYHWGHQRQPISKTFTISAINLPTAEFSKLKVQVLTCHLLGQSHFSDNRLQSGLKYFLQHSITCQKIAPVLTKICVTNGVVFQK